MTPELKKKLEACDTLPTPSGIAVQIVHIANDPDASLNQVAELLGMDPAISIKVLRLANSPLYALRRKIPNLREAIVVLGMDATISLALSFSLLKSWQRPNSESKGFDFALFLRRALLSAAIGRILAKRLRLHNAEDLFLTCLIQDVGVLALARAVDGLYDGLGIQQASQRILIKREQERLQTDHAAVSGWLLSKWNFPDLITRGVSASHRPGQVPSYSEHAKFVRCVALSSLVAESFLRQDKEDRFLALADAAQEYLQINSKELEGVLAESGAAIADIESIFETEILTKTDTESILEEAHKALTKLTIESLQTVKSLRKETESLEERASELEEANKRDGLTQLYNRNSIFDHLASALRSAAASHEPLSVAFVDLDHFKQVNDLYGHQVGDQVLTKTARILQESVRSSDFAGRYGGEEFVLVLPDSNPEQAMALCERILTTLRDTSHDVNSGESLTVTVSIGVATQSDECRFESVDAFVGAADKALYRAKLEGRNRARTFEQVS